MADKRKFEDIVRAMSAREIIEAMVEGLREPCVRIDMGTYGNTAYPMLDDENESDSLEDRICYGCAATNTVCKISGHVFAPEEISDRTDRANAVLSEYRFLFNFEEAIDDLRRGSVSHYNERAFLSGFAKIVYPEYWAAEGRCLPNLGNHYTADELQAYLDLAVAQPVERKNDAETITSE